MFAICPVEPNLIIRLMAKQLFVALAFLFACGPSYAQFYVHPSLNEEEKKVFAMIGGDSPAYRSYMRNTALFSHVQENLRRAALLARCTRLMHSHGDMIYFDPETREAVMRVVAKHVTGEVGGTSIGVFRWNHRAVLWATSDMLLAQKDSLFRFVETVDGRRAFALYETLRILTTFKNASIDVNTGRTMAAPLLLLKQYFVEANQMDIFGKFLNVVASDLRAQIEALPTLTEVGKADVETHTRLATNFLTHDGQFLAAFVQSLSPTDRQILERLGEFPFITNMEDAAIAVRWRTDRELAEAFSRMRNASPGQPTTSSDASASGSAVTQPKRPSQRGTPSYLRDLGEWIDHKFPRPPEWQEYAAGLNPLKLSDSAHVQFCPNAAR
jgi:hypothetical protein